jgi:SM-20-related protein
VLIFYRQEQALATDPADLLPPVTFLDKLTDVASLRILTRERLVSLESEGMGCGRNSVLTRLAGFFVIDSYLSADELQTAVSEAHELRAAGRLRPAEMRSEAGKANWQQKSLRGDEIAWLRSKQPEGASTSGTVPALPEPQSERAMDRTIAALERLRVELDSHCDFRCSHTQVMLACYPGGDARYTRHLDASKSCRRRLTLLVYLNPAWQPEHGGQLRLHLPSPSGGAASKVARDIEPIGGRLVVFQSRTLEHEVCQLVFVCLC